MIVALTFVQINDIDDLFEALANASPREEFIQVIIGFEFNHLESLNRDRTRR